MPSFKNNLTKKSHPIRNTERDQINSRNFTEFYIEYKMNR